MDRFIATWRFEDGRRYIWAGRFWIMLYPLSWRRRPRFGWDDSR